MTKQPDASRTKPRDDTSTNDKKETEEEKEEEIELKPDSSNFISFANYKSRDAERPDIIKVIADGKDGETFETELSTCVQVKDLEGKSKRLPLKYHNSSNPGLLPLWTLGIEKGKIRQGKKVIIKTWLSKSKKGRDIRRFKLVV